MNLSKAWGKILSFAAGTFLFFLLPLANSAAAPSLDNDRELLPTIYEAAIESAGGGNFSELVTLLFHAFDEGSLEARFDGDTKFTLFGPNNDAISSFLSSLDGDQTAALMDQDSGLLAELLLYHVALGDWYASSFPIGLLQMENGDLARVYLSGEAVEIEGATIMGETVLRNGVFHGVHSVVIPPGFIEQLNEWAAR